VTTPATQPAPIHIQVAGYALACVLDGDLDVDARLTLTEALRILTDVHPAYEPITEPVEPMPLAEGLARTRLALAGVIAASTDIGDLLRAARAAQVLAVLPAMP